MLTDCQTYQLSHSHKIFLLQKNKIHQYWLDSKEMDAPFHPCGTVQNPIQQMEHEHDDAGRLLQSLRDLTNNYVVPQDGCSSYRALYDGLNSLEQDLHRHVHLENYVLHPLVIRMEQEIQEKVVSF